MALGNKIAQSPLRPTIDELILKGFSSKKIAHHLFESGASDTFSEKTISDYKANIFRQKDSPLMAVAAVVQNLTDNDPPPGNNSEMLASHFTFNSTKADLDFIYSRINTLKILAEANPEDDQYDKRIQDYMNRAEKIRERVFKFQYEQIRRAILVSVGKKICMAAVSIFLPYVNKDKRAEAVERFESAVTPMLGKRDMPSEPFAEDAEIVESAPSAAVAVAPTPPPAPPPPPPAAPAPAAAIVSPPVSPEFVNFMLDGDDDGQAGE